MIKKIIISIIVIVILGAGYYFISPLFINIKVNESIPEMNIVSDNKNTDKEIQTADTKVFPVVGTNFHPASGSVRIINAKDGKVVRYENFKTINGPDLYVYLSKDINAKDFINLGEIKGTEGNINYSVPKDINIEEYRYVLTWCKKFGVLFNYAEILF